MWPEGRGLVTSDEKYVRKAYKKSEMYVAIY